MTAPGIAWVLGSTIAAEIGDIARFASPRSSPGIPDCAPGCTSPPGRDHRGPLAKNGPRYLRWALLEAATHAAPHPCYADHYQATRKRLGRQRGAKVARGRGRPQARRGDLAHAHHPGPVPPGKAPRTPSGRLTALD
jgi:transposase